jgi:hypothetical protein
MAEELTRSLETLAERGTPRGAAAVLEHARSDAAGSTPVQSRWAMRPAWAAVTAFAATLAVLGGSMVLGMAFRQPARDVGSAWIIEAVDDGTATTAGWWLLLPTIAVAVAVAIAVAIVVRNRQVGSRQERAMATTIDSPPVERLEKVEHSNRRLVVAVVLLAVALVALGAWVMYDLASAPDTAPTDEITAVYDDYLASWVEQDSEAFLGVTTEDYFQTSFGTITTRSERANGLRQPGLSEIERIGDLMVMRDGTTYFVAAAERITFMNVEYVGVSAYRMVETEEGLKIAEHGWIGNL